MLFGAREKPVPAGSEVIPREKLETAYREYRRLLDEVIAAGKRLDQAYKPLAAGRYTAADVAGREAELAHAFTALAKDDHWGPIPLLRDQIPKIHDACAVIGTALWEQKARREKEERAEAAELEKHQAEVAEARAAAERLQRALARQG